MPKLPVLKDKKMLQVLRKLGFFEHRQHGTSHLVMKHRDGRRTVVPIHPGRDIPPGTLLAILKDINLKPGELRELL